MIVVQSKQRRSIRLQDHDYAQSGAYFVTVCAQKKECLFGEIVDGEIKANEVGEIIRACWDEIPVHFPNVETDVFVVMPNHIHGIVLIVGAQHAAPAFSPPRCGDTLGAACCAPTEHIKPRTLLPDDVLSKRRNVPAGSLGAVIRSFKSAATKRVNEVRGICRPSIWQRNYFEHVIRDESALERIREYVVYNRLQWDFDPQNPMAIKAANVGKGSNNSVELFYPIARNNYEQAF